MTLVFVLAAFLAAVPLFTFAAILPTIVPCDGTSINGGTECTICHLAQLAQNGLNVGIYMAVFLSAILFAWAGWLYVTAGGNQQQASRGRQIFTNVAIGIVIILAGWLIVDTIMKTLVKTDDRFGPWNQICTGASPFDESGFESAFGQ
jgi:hypothetical protein